MKRTVTLEIAGAKYRMTSDTDEAHLQHLADIVNERVEELGPKAARSASPAQLLAVVALGLADDLASSERRRERIEQTTRKVVEAAIDRIDRRLESDTRSAEESTDDSDDSASANGAGQDLASDMPVGRGIAPASDSSAPPLR